MPKTSDLRNHGVLMADPRYRMINEEYWPLIVAVLEGLKGFEAALEESFDMAGGVPIWDSTEILFNALRDLERK